jgi:hypothetical protein
MGVYLALLEPGDKVMGMRLDQGGHLTHGSPVNFSGRLYEFVAYGIDPDTEVLDYNQIGARLGLSRDCARQRLHRALARLLSADIVHGAGDRRGTTRARCRLCRGLRQEAVRAGPVLSWQERERILALQVALGAVARCPECGQLTPVANLVAARHGCRPRRRRSQLEVDGGSRPGERPQRPAAARQRRRPAPRA